MLVSILDTNVVHAKTDIKTDAISYVNQLSVVDSVKTVAIKDLTDIFDNTDTTKQNALQMKLTNDIKNALTSLPSAQHPTNNNELSQQKTEIQNVINKITTDKDNKLADSFDKVFQLAAIIPLATCFIGIFTDRKDDPNIVAAVSENVKI